MLGFKRKPAKIVKKNCKTETNEHNNLVILTLKLILGTNKKKMSQKINSY